MVDLFAAIGLMLLILVNGVRLIQISKRATQIVFGSWLGFWGKVRALLWTDRYLHGKLWRFVKDIAMTIVLAWFFARLVPYQMGFMMGAAAGGFYSMWTLVGDQYTARFKGLDHDPLAK